MKRKIKFRAWHLGHKRMFTGNEVVSICFKSNHLLLYDQYGWTTLATLDLMQFTGLHDENGKEIYEGDILNTLHGTLAVEFNDDTCKFQFSNGMDINDREMYGMSKIIIGNIYENENLLT
jgi:uncharacterized phage protein (TIGR01671 family)